ncbi:MAG: preprotein translocase subunit YajC [Myxococcales bacterium]|nr:preprotein translocase subunit YajC [Myxococcales bacterium]
MLAEGAAPPGGAFTGMLPLILMFAVFYFLVIGPQRKAEKQRQERIKGIQRGDQVVLEGGIVGRVVNPDAGDGLATVEIADRVKVKVIKARINDTAASALKKSDAKDADAKSDKSDKSDDKKDEARPS